MGDVQGEIVRTTGRRAVWIDVVLPGQGSIRFVWHCLFPKSCTEGRKSGRRLVTGRYLTERRFLLPPDLLNREHPVIPPPRSSFIPAGDDSVGGVVSNAKSTMYNASQRGHNHPSFDPRNHVFVIPPHLGKRNQRTAPAWTLLSQTIRLFSCGITRVSSLLFQQTRSYVTRYAIETRSTDAPGPKRLPSVVPKGLQV